MKTPATLAERDARYGRLRAALAQAGLDALLVAGKGHWWTGRGYLRYPTDFHLWGHDGLLLIPLHGEPSLALTSHAVAQRIAARGWIEDVAGDVYLVPRTARSVQERRHPEHAVRRRAPQRRLGPALPSHVSRPCMARSY